MARTIETSILIAAPASRVWSVLMDFDGYPAWNPFIRTIKGEQRTGARLEVGIEAPGHKAQTFRPVIVEVEPERFSPGADRSQFQVSLSVCIGLPSAPKVRTPASWNSFQGCLSRSSVASWMPRSADFGP